MDQIIQNDFDAIAEATPEYECPNHNNKHHPVILNHLPDNRGHALDIGCGTGELIEILATRFSLVTGIDFSHKMIARARKRLSRFSNVKLLETDILDWQRPPEGYDLIVSMATFHHLPFSVIMEQCRDWLNPSGVIVIVDLCRPSSITDYGFAAASFAANTTNRLLLGKYNVSTPELKEAWARHGEHERYPFLADIRKEAEMILPGAEVHNLLYWRYILTWRNVKEQT